MPLSNEIRRFKRNTAVITAVYNYQFDFHLFGYNRLDIHAGAISYLYSAFKLSQPCEIRCKLYKNPVVLYRPYNAGDGFTYRKTFCVLLPRSEQFLVRKTDMSLIPTFHHRKNIIAYRKSVCRMNYLNDPSYRDFYDQMLPDSVKSEYIAPEIRNFNGY